MQNTVHMTPGIKKRLLNEKHSEEIRKALDRFRTGDIESTTGKPDNSLIDSFGRYELSFGTVWIISYHLFSSRDFITLLLPSEYEGSNLK